MNLTEWGKSIKVAPNEVKFASTWLWSSFSNLWRAYKIIVEIHTQQNSPNGLKVYVLPLQWEAISNVSLFFRMIWLLICPFWKKVKFVFYFLFIKSA